MPLIRSARSLVNWSVHSQALCIGLLMTSNYRRAVRTRLLTTSHKSTAETILLLPVMMMVMMTTIMKAMMVSNYAHRPRR